jgi:hypothetical protein
MRRLGVSAAEINRLVGSGPPVDWDQDGKPRYEGVVNGKMIRVVLAVDAPGMVVTVYARRK